MFEVVSATHDPEASVHSVVYRAVTHHKPNELVTEYFLYVA